MARDLTPRDCYALINLMVKEATGQDAALQAVDSSTFVSAGETILNTGYENTLNAVSMVLGRTMMAVRPFKAKLYLINTLKSGLYANRIRKISYYSREAQESGAFNTQLNTNHAMGYDNGNNSGNSTASMWVQNQPVPLELNFAGSSTWQDSTTVYEWQLQQAFRDEGSFAEFVAGILTEKANDIESQKEAFNRVNMLNFMAGIYDLNASTGGAINLTAAYNAKFGTSKVTADLLGADFKDFLEFFVSTVKTISDTLTNRSIKYHWSPAKTIGGVNYVLLRHTPKAKQRFLLNAGFWRDAEARVMPEVFNDQYLDINNFEAVEFWQNENDPTGIDVIPAIPDTSSPGSQTVGAEVKLSVVLGLIYDEDALLTDYQLDTVNTTPLEARKGYRNTWYTFRKNAINDFTENGVLLYMAD